MLQRWDSTGYYQYRGINVNVLLAEVVVQTDPKGEGLLRGCWLSNATAEMRRPREPYKKTAQTKENSFTLAANLVISSASFSSGRPISPPPACIATLLPEQDVGGVEEEEVVGLPAL